MNNTVINIQGIKVIHKIINLEGSSDQAHYLVIKDEYGNEVEIQIIRQKITDAKNNCNKH